MTKTHVLTASLALLLSYSGSPCLHAPKVEPGENFVINENRPFVYIKFEHIGPGIRVKEDEPDTRIWLHLTNNCRVPIEVQANGVPNGSPKDEVGLMHDVVQNRSVWGLFPSYAASAPRPPGLAKPVERESSTFVEQMPRGYMSDVGSLVTIMPGKEVLFSIPINHISKQWHVEIPFEFELPKGIVPRDPKVSLGPSMVISYSIWDMPPEFQSKVEQQR